MTGKRLNIQPGTRRLRPAHWAPHCIVSQPIKQQARRRELMLAWQTDRLAVWMLWVEVDRLAVQRRRHDRLVRDGTDAATLGTHQQKSDRLLAS